MLQTLYSVEEAADYLKAHPKTVRKWVVAGRLAAHCSGRRLVFTDEDLASFVKPANGGDPNGPRRKDGG